MAFPTKYGKKSPPKGKKFGGKKAGGGMQEVLASHIRTRKFKKGKGK